MAKKMPEFSRSSLSGLFDKQLVEANGKSIKASYKISSGDQIKIDTALLTAQPAKIKLPILYEDGDVIVINKPAGILTHAKGALNTEATVVSFIKLILNDKKLTGNRAGIVHRLDRATSGVIITAKNERALKWLQKQFSTRKTKKIYFAIVEGRPEPTEAIIDAPIERNPKKPQTFRVSGNGKPAQTKYKVLKTSDSGGLSTLELQPLTGRTHQLRVHLKYIGHPIVGDRVYGRSGEYLLLHAKSLELTLPSGERKIFVAPEPEYLKEYVQL